MPKASDIVITYSGIHLAPRIFFHYYSKADMRASDNSDMTPFMIALKKGNVEVMIAMMEKDPNLESLPVGSLSKMIHWALKEGHHQSAFFKVCFHFIPYLATLQHFNLIYLIPIFVALLD